MVEVVISMLVSIFLFLAMFAGLLAIKSLSNFAERRTQAFGVVRGQIERLKGTPFDAIATVGPLDRAYDAGEDGVFGTGDDLTGSLSVLVQDFMDFDDDGDTDETGINIDNNGGVMARPVRVTFTWNQRLLGQVVPMTVSLDTLISR